MTPQTVEIPVAEYRFLLIDAQAWRILRKSPRLGEVLSALLDPPTIRDLGITVQPADPKRVQYDRPPLSPEQIRMNAALSWADAEAQIPAHATDQQAAA